MKKTILVILLLLVAILLFLEHDRVMALFHVPASSEAQVQAGPKQLWTCGMHPQVIQDHPGDCPICHMKLTPLNTRGPGNAPVDGAAVTIDPAVMQNMGVRLATVSEGPLVRSVRMVGYLNEAQPNIRDINLRVSGWIRHLQVKTEGQHVRVGDPLFDLYSPELQVGIEELISARRAKASAVEDSSKQMAATLYDASARKLELLGLPRVQIEALAKLDKAPEEITFTSPIEGDVTQKPVVEGAMVKAESMALQIVDHTALWLDAQVFEMDLPFVQVGQMAEATVASRPGETITGKILFIHPQVDPATRTALVRMEIPNTKLELKPGMYATLHAQANLADKVVLAPREAVIDTGDRQLVFVAQGGGKFAPRKVQMGFGDDQGRVQILSGLKPGEQVVSSGQFLIDSESRLKEAVEKFIREKNQGMPEKNRDRQGAGVFPDPNSLAASQSHPLPDGRSSFPMASGQSDGVLSAYLALSTRLGAGETDKTPLNADVLVQAAHKLHAALGQDGRMAQIMRVGQAAEALKGQPLAEQRKFFKELSAAMIALTQVLPPSDKMAAGLFLMHCPMAKADWLQQGDAPANPYYAVDMKECADPAVPLAPKGKE